MPVELRHVSLPEFQIPTDTPAISEVEYAQRNQFLYELAGTEWVAVYGDREHNANLLYLTGFDPRFEEALLLLGSRERRFLLVGNEGVIHAQIAGLPLEVVLYQPFSLMSQPRGDSPALNDLLTELGMLEGATVGVAGWKYFEEDEDEVADVSLPAYVPAYLINLFEATTGQTPVDVTHVLMNPVNGLRSIVSAAEIAKMEWGTARASAAVLRVVHGTRPGMTELEAIGAMGYQGEPMTCHPILASSDWTMNGLRSPTTRVIEEGDAVSCGIGYWGGLCCRAGIVSGEGDSEFVESVVKPYFAAVAAWWQTLAIGVAGGEVFDAVIAPLAQTTFLPMLNPGHLTSYDEWVHSPIYEGSLDPISSGMVLQCDIIPTPLAPGQALNCEDTVAIADGPLRAEIAIQYPELWNRIEARRAFMEDRLGLRLHPEVLPLSHAPAYLPPFWFAPDLVCTVTE